MICIGTVFPQPFVYILVCSLDVLKLIVRNLFKSCHNKIYDVRVKRSLVPVQ